MLYYTVKFTSFFLSLHLVYSIITILFEMFIARNSYLYNLSVLKRSTSQFFWYPTPVDHGCHHLLPQSCPTKKTWLMWSSATHAFIFPGASCLMLPFCRTLCFPTCSFLFSLVQRTICHSLVRPVIHAFFLLDSLPLHLFFNLSQAAEIFVPSLNSL